ncbi:MAG: threonine/serine dehydratase [Gemmatimonadetes bacterium]|nr:threonine/serine dehydratase [Gemmatimonadota bacterium]
MAMSELVRAADIERAAAALAGVALHTPLLPAPWLSARLGGEVRLKCENLQRAGAFKIRGAYTAIARLTPAERARGVIAYSSGNHAQGVALAARLFHIQAVVVMPPTAPEVKRAGAERLGAELVLAGTTSQERQVRAEAIAAERGRTIIPAFDDLNIITGQGTVGKEILEDWPDVDTVLVQIGGGGLIAGTAAYLKQRKPDCRVIGVEPETADAMKRSIDAGEPVTIPFRGTIADGLMPVRPGAHNFAHVRAYVDDIVRVSDEAIADATGQLLRTSKLIVEFSGAATVAALLAGHVAVTGRRVAAVLSGGNLDPVRALELLKPPAGAA